MIARLRKKLSAISGAQVFMAPVQDIRAGGRPSPALYQYTLQAGDLNELRDWAPRVLEAFNHIDILTDVNTDQQSKGLQIKLVINREAAARYGISVNTIDQTLNDAFGQRLVSTIYAPLNQYRVVMEADAKYQQRPESLNDIYLISAGGQRVPLAALAHYEPDTTPLQVNHQGLFAASTISFNLAKGVSLGQAQQAIAVEMARIGLPGTIQGGFQGTAKLFQDTLNNQPLFILTALLVIYIVLGILYESTIHPLTILSTLPSAGVGAVMALMLFHTDFSIIALIGVFLLIGIVKKNAILMVDFALQIERDTGASPRESIHEACLLRLRPILMTTLAALFTALPLAMISGNGAELRQPLGISIAGGLIVSQLITLYTTPVIYLQLDKFRHWSRRRWAQPQTSCSINTQSSKESSMNPTTISSILLQRRMTMAYSSRRVTSVILGIGLMLSACAVGPDYIAAGHRISGAVQGKQGLGTGCPARGSRAGRLVDDFRGRDTEHTGAARGQAPTRACALPITLISKRWRLPTSRAPPSTHTGCVSFVHPFFLGTVPRLQRNKRYVHRGRGNRWASPPAGSPDLVGQGAAPGGGRTKPVPRPAMTICWRPSSVCRPRLAQDYFLIRQVDSQIVLAQDTVTAYEKFLQLTQNRYAAGVVTKADVAQAQTQLATCARPAFRLQCAASATGTRHCRAGRRSAVEFQSAACGRTAATPAHSGRTAIAIAAAPPRPGRLRAASGCSQRTDRRGQVRLFPRTDSFRPTRLARPVRCQSVSAPNVFWSVGPSLAETLFDAGARSAQVAQSQSAYQQVVAQYRQLSLQALQQVEDQLAALSALAEEAELQQAAVAAADESLRLATNQYKAGTASYLNVISAQTASYTARNGQLQIAGQRLTANVALIQALGGGWENHVQQVEGAEAKQPEKAAN